jgi:N6-adenosine-specific RNA methylase IME4
MSHLYRTIVVDPPWPQNGGGPLKGGHAEGFIGTRGSQPMPYPVMSLPKIASMDITSLADPTGCHLYLWTTNGFLPAAFSIVDGWGFRYSTLLVWAKNPMGGGLGGAYGISTEYCLFARKGNCATTSRIRGTWFNWKRPYDERGKPRHSAKPTAFYDMVKTVSPGPYVELFARQSRAEWDTWGDQTPNALNLDMWPEATSV